MGIKEILYFRIPQLMQTHIKGRFQEIEVPRKLSLNLSFKAVKYNVNDLNDCFKETAFSTQFNVFTQAVDVFKLTNWREDVLNKITSPKNYYGNIKRQDFETNGDVKFVAELSRFEFLPFIAFKAVSDVSVKEDYLYNIEQIVTKWNKQNPFLNSIHWTSGIEVGIRSVNLVYTHIILKQFNSLSNALETEITSQLHFNYLYLKNHLSLYSSANNHLMAELMGLNVIASYFQVNKKETAKWKALFFKQVDRQVNPDGVHMELCTRYHAEVTDQIIISIEFLKQAGNSIPKEILEKSKSLFNFTEHVEYYNIETVFGDDDGGYVVNPYFDNKFSLYNSQLGSSNYLFNTDYKTIRNVDFRNYLIFGRQFVNTLGNKKQEDILFESSGYSFMYDHNTKTKLSFDCGIMGDHISAAHGHSDVFHFNLSVNDIPFLIDSGTYQYHTKYLSWRDYFRSVKAHNTISVNNKNHAVNNGRMSWIDCPETRVMDNSFSEAFSFCEAQTNAFLRDGVMHSRRIEFNKIKKEIIVTDNFASNDNDSKAIQFYLHFHPDVNVDLKKETVILKSRNTSVKIINKEFKKARLLKGDKEMPLGWCSNNFNKKQSTTSLFFTYQFINELHLQTTLIYND
ncbi:hypothetical protein ES677_04765 [Bizionia gelidisalsuginis]|uniref:Heparin-sulfate lyase N-terminal domain-containing protein n=1 Tax=Bizionia gelidisalsuginis TaxID=291188 RepID=A0ABY3MCK2_9FLAO|nr:alginate lyase family protein [Bizionia gelidisalsuginis]TYC15657.1 hypothetical protein ES677_04765 [Bizionia gelidisalsuginis]